jgi:perosamine synthetase
MKEFLPYGHQFINEVDIAAVCEVLRSDFLTCGPKVEEFERYFAAAVGAKHAVAVNSATAALHLAMRVSGIGPGDRVITSPNTFLASANAAVYVDATPDFSDIDAVSYNVDPVCLKETWQPDVKAVVAVDYAGQACDMPAIAEIAHERGAIVIEDACHGVGGGFMYKGRAWKLGGHPWADLTVFSFHAVKTMTTGEGGMLVTENEEWARRARRLRSHGIERDPARFVGLFSESTSQLSTLNSQLAEHGPWYHEMAELGYNYRITDLQCALGLSQLTRLDRFVARRREIMSLYNAAFSHLSWLTTPGVKNALNRDRIAWHLYTIEIDFEAIGKSRTEVMTELRQKGVGTQVLYIPVYLQPFYQNNYGYTAGKCPVAEKHYLGALSLPLYPAMATADCERVVTAVTSLVR